MKIGLSLSGGLGYGFAHIGVIKALEALGIKPSVITGTSVGSLIGGLYAAGLPIAKIEKIAVEFKWAEILKFIIPKDGLISLEKLEGFVKKYSPVDRIEKTKIKFAAVATDLTSGEEKIFVSGPMGVAIRASCSLPGIFTPAVINGRVYVDGGVMNNLPVDVARKLGADAVIGVDVLAKASPNVLLKTEIVHIFWKSIQLMMQVNSSKRQYGKADVILSPEIGEMNPFDLSHAEQIIIKGTECVEYKRKQIEAAASGRKGFYGAFGRLFRKK